MKKLLKILMIPSIIGFLGMFLNVLVSKLNGGMPAYIEHASLNKLGYDALNLPYPKWIGLDETTKLRFLADILPFNLSIGDVLIYGSLIAYAVIMVVWIARSRKPATVTSTSPS